MVHRYNGSVLLTGTKAQFEQAEIILKQNKRNVYNLTGKTSLILFPALLQRCDISMGVDTAGGHIAAAVGTPTVTIFGPGNFAKWAPYGSRSKIVHKGWDCIPCNKMGCNGSGKSRCLNELSVSEVKADIEDFLNDALASG
jgi:ADP-heptose:LPS heptosyltransferase